MANVKLNDLKRVLIETHEVLAEVTHIMELFERQAFNGKMPVEIEVPDDVIEACAKEGEKAEYAADCEDER
jgi:hypothetical protein